MDKKMTVDEKCQQSFERKYATGRVRIALAEQMQLKQASVEGWEESWASLQNSKKAKNRRTGCKLVEGALRALYSLLHPANQEITLASFLRKMKVYFSESI